MTTIINTTIEERYNILASGISESSEEVNAPITEVIPQTTNDYNKLLNKPTINGKLLVGNYEEEDPTVPEWAKEPNKPSYTAEEVGALPSDTHIPSTLAEMLSDEEHMTVSAEEKAEWNTPHFSGRYEDLTGEPENLSDFNNDEGFITEETDPTVPGWAKADTKPSYTPDEVNALDRNNVIPLSELQNMINSIF